METFQSFALTLTLSAVGAIGCTLLLCLLR